MAPRKSKSAARKPVSASKRADVTFPVGRLCRLLKTGKYSDRIGQGAGVFMAAVLDYLCEEILDMAAEHCQKAKKMTLQPRHIQLAIRSDEELNKVMCEAMIANGGVVPSIHPSLFPAKKGAKGAGATQEM